jgi:hypothetical protein
MFDIWRLPPRRGPEDLVGDWLRGVLAAANGSGDERIVLDSSGEVKVEGSLVKSFSEHLDSGSGQASNMATSLGSLRPFSDIRALARLPKLLRRRIGTKAIG